MASVVLSANWMWPAKQPGEDARLYAAVGAVSEFAIALGIPIPTGKDSMSMTMAYPDGQSVKAPGTVIISAAAETGEVTDCVTPDLKPVQGSQLVHIPFAKKAASSLGGSSFAQTLASIGEAPADVSDPTYFSSCFAFIQKLVAEKRLLAAHDISAGGLMVCILEMAFCGDIGFDVKLPSSELQLAEDLFSETPGVVLQLEDEEAKRVLSEARSGRTRSPLTR